MMNVNDYDSKISIKIYVKDKKTQLLSHHNKLNFIKLKIQGFS